MNHGDQISNTCSTLPSKMGAYDNSTLNSNYEKQGKNNEFCESENDEVILYPLSKVVEFTKVPGKARQRASVRSKLTKRK